MMAAMPSEVTESMECDTRQSWSYTTARGAPEFSSYWSMWETISDRATCCRAAELCSSGASAMRTSNLFSNVSATLEPKGLQGSSRGFGSVLPSLGRSGLGLLESSMSGKGQASGREDVRETCQRTWLQACTTPGRQSGPS